MFGAIGALATVGTTVSDRDAIQALAESNDVHIDKIMVQELTDALQASGKLPLADASQNASATIKVKIKQYGFSVPHGFTWNVVPILLVQCEMVDQSGQVIWKGGTSLQPLDNPVDSFPASTLNDAKVINAAWHQASQAAAKSIVDGLPPTTSAAQQASPSTD